MSLSVPDIDQKIRKLKTLRNTIAAPLCYVAPELLIYVLQDHDIDGWDVLAVYASCTSLRNKLASIPEVWGNIPNSPRREVLDHFLYHSGTALLSCHFGLVDQSHSYAIESIKKHLHRFRSLAVDIGLETSTLMAYLHTHEAPHLQTFAQRQNPPPWYKLPDSKPPVTASLLGGVCTHLISLRLSRINLVGLPKMPNLTVLNLVACDAELRSIHDVLQALPMLEHLELVQVLNAQPFSYTGLSSVSLPALQSLRLQHNIDCVVAILRIIPDPSLYLSIKIDKAIEWSSTSGPNAEVLDRLLTFWTVVSEDEELPPMSLSVTCIEDTPDFTMQHYERTTQWQILEIGHDCDQSQTLIDPQLHYSARCEIHGTDPMLDKVETLILRPIAGTEAIRGLDDWRHIDDDVSLHWLTAVKDLKIVYTSTIVGSIADGCQLAPLHRDIEDLRRVRVWLERLVEEGNDIEDMEITLEGGGTEMEQFMNRLCKAGLAERHNVTLIP
jgi:hypothetical protein